MLTRSVLPCCFAMACRCLPLLPFVSSPPQPPHTECSIMATATPSFTLRPSSVIEGSPSSDAPLGLPQGSYASAPTQAAPPSLLKQATQSKGLQRWVLIEALVGSVLILAAPFLGDYLAPHGVGGKVLGVFFAMAHYGFHVIGGAVLFKAGLDIGSLSHCHKH
jgi:hypothetical protein